MGIASNGSGMGIGMSSPQFASVATARFISAGDKRFESVVLSQAEVLDIDLANSDATQIGRIKFRFISESGRDTNNLSWAYPFSSNIRQYPVTHEIVCIFQLNGKYFYLFSLNSIGYINNNALTNLTKKTSLEKSEKINKYREVESSGIPNNNSSTAVDESLGENFKSSNLLIPLIKPSEGDIIIEGRFGNYIKLGSNQPKSLLPSIKIGILDNSDDSTFKFSTEQLNNNSNIWMTSDESLDFKKPDTKIGAGNTVPELYDGKQIILSSDRIIFNAKFNEILMFSNKGVHIAANGNYSVDSGNSILINSKSDIKISTNSILNIKSKSETVFQSPNIYIGDKNKSEPLILGYKLVKILEKLIDAILNEKHATGTGPTSPPLNSADFVKIKQSLTYILSQRNFTV